MFIFSALDTEEIERCKSSCPLNDILENGKIHAKDSYKMIALYLMAQLQSSPSQVYNPPSCPSSAVVILCIIVVFSVSFV